MLPYEGRALMMDTEGNILSVVYLGSGEYQGEIEVYERRIAGTIDDYLESKRRNNFV